MAVAGVWRDYAHQSGTIVVNRDWYVQQSGDRTASEGSIWVTPGVRVEAVAAALRSRFPHGDTLQLISSPDLRRLSMRIFDRAFAITYALEAVAVVIGHVNNHKYVLCIDMKVSA